MTRRRERRTTETILYVLTAIVALSMVIGLVGPILIREPVEPTPTWPPTWTFTPAPTRTPTQVPAQTPTLPPTPSATTTHTPAPSPAAIVPTSTPRP